MSNITITQTKIIEYLLFHKEDPHTIRGLARALKKSYPLVYNNLKDLEEKNIVETKKVPPVKLISLSDSLPKEIVIHIEIERKNSFLGKKTWAKVMIQDILSKTDLLYFTLLIFGSYAKGSHNNKSDIDLLGIVPSKKEIEELEDTLRRTYSPIKKNIIVITIDDFREMTRNPKDFNVGNEAIKNHIVLYGIEQFVEIGRTKK
jgi:predicted nucleotidyltransferase